MARRNFGRARERDRLQAASRARRDEAAQRRATRTAAHPSKPPTERQLKYIAQLARDLGQQAPTPASRRDATLIIRALLRKATHLNRVHPSTSQHASQGSSGRKPHPEVPISD